MINIAIDHLGLTRSADSSRHDARTLTPAPLDHLQHGLVGRHLQGQARAFQHELERRVRLGGRFLRLGGEPFQVKRAGWPILAEFLDCAEETFGAAAIDQRGLVAASCRTDSRSSMPISSLRHNVTRSP